MANLRARTVLLVLTAFVSFGGAAAACTDLKNGGDDLVDGSAADTGTSPKPGEVLPDGALADGATSPGPSDATTDARDAQYQFDGGIVPRPTCVGTSTSESWVPAPGCVPNAGPGMCTFTKVTRTCKNASCRDGYCQELTFTAQPVATPPKFVYQVWGAAPDAIWAVGNGVFFWNGSAWSEVDVGVTFDNFTEAYAVAGTTRDDVTILTGNSNIGPMVLRRRDAGGVFRAVNTIQTNVWGGGLFALGANRFLVHLGGRGVYFAAPGQTTFLGSLYGFPAMHHYTNALSGFKANDVLVASAGADGTFYFDGAELKKVGPLAHALLYTPNVLAFLSSGSKIDLFEPTGGTRIGAQVDLPTALSAPGSTWKGIDGTSLDRFWVCDADGVVARRDASGTFTRETIPTPMQTNAVFASPWGDVYVAGSRVWHGQ